jgi:hypothetical protein
MIHIGDLQLTLGSTPQEEELLIYFDHSKQVRISTHKEKNLSTDQNGYKIQNCLNKSSDYTLNHQASPHKKVKQSRYRPGVAQRVPGS